MDKTRHPVMELRKTAGVPHGAIHSYGCMTGGKRSSTVFRAAAGCYDLSPEEIELGMRGHAITRSVPDSRTRNEDIAYYILTFEDMEPCILAESPYPHDLEGDDQQEGKDLGTELQ